MLGVRRRVGFFQTLECAENFCAIWSYLSTAHKHEISYYDAAIAAFNGTAMQLLFPDGMPVEPESSKASDSTGADATKADVAAEADDSTKAVA
ncbi:MAG: hypothetical protein IJ088_10485 [Clostridia bacterium]|nr:hypothetical protein [Clostridia bacterium]